MNHLVYVYNAYKIKLIFFVRVKGFLHFYCTKNGDFCALFLCFLSSLHL